MTKDKLSVIEHIKFGPIVYTLRRQLIDVWVEVARAFGKTKAIAKQARKVSKEFDKLCCLLDDEYYRLGAEGNSPYYSKTIKLDDTLQK